MSKQMQSFVDLDSVTLVCPCGDSVTGEGEVIGVFMKKHKKHTDGTCREIVTDDGARCLSEKPAPRVIKL